ncbi:MAG: ABC transporter substrate-binding protein [Roseburia sp.]
MKKRKFLALILTAVLALGIVGCSDGETSTDSADNVVSEENVTAEADSEESATESKEGEIVEGGEIVLGSATEITDFNPFNSITADTRAVTFNIYEGLVKVESDGSFVPAVASEYEVSDDGKTYSFTLRDGIKFHNGNEVTVDDVLYSIQKSIDSASAGYDQIASFEVNDAGQIVITLSEANTGFIPYLTQPIVPKDYEDLSLNPIGTGPYKLTEYAEQDYIVLEKNTDYWGDGGHLDKITIKFAASQEDLVILFTAGTIDGFSASASTVNQLPEDTYNLQITLSNAVQLLALNNDFEPFQDVRVRQAINYAVSSDEIIDLAFYGYGTKVGSGLIPALEVYYDDSLVDAYNQDLDKAKELLAEAGYEDGFSFTITVPSVYEAHIDTAEVIVNQLAAIGINAEIKQVDWATWLEKVYQGREYESTIISLDGSLAYPTAFLSRYVSDASNNFVNFNSQNYDEVYANAVATADETERIALFKEAQQILSEEAASVYIQDIAGFRVLSKNFDGYKGYPLYAEDYSAIYRVAE